MVVEVHHDGSYDAIPAHAGERCVVSRVWCSTVQTRLGCVVGGHHRAVDVRGMRWVVCCVLPLFKSPPCFVRFADFGRTCTKSCARTSAFRRCHQQRTLLVPSHSFRRNYALLIFRFRKRNYGLPTLISEYRSPSFALQLLLSTMVPLCVCEDKGGPNQSYNRALEITASLNKYAQSVVRGWLTVAPHPILLTT